MSASQSQFPKRMAMLTGTIVLGLIVSLLTGFWTVWGQEHKTFGLGEQEAWYPHDAVKFAGQTGLPRRAFLSHFGLAAVYEYHLGPAHRVFMDGRLEVVSRETYGLYQEILRRMSLGDPSWMAMIRDEAGNMPVIILGVRSQKEIRGLYGMPNWRPVFTDSAAIVFLEEDFAEKLNLPRLQILFPNAPSE